MKKLTWHDATLRATHAGELNQLPSNAFTLLVAGFLKIWNDRRRPKYIQCSQAQLIGHSRLSLRAFKEARKELVNLDLIRWEHGKQNSRAATYSLGPWFYDLDQEADHIPDQEADRDSTQDSSQDPDSLYRERDRDKSRDNTPVVPKGTEWVPDDLQRRINSWFRRKDTTRWNDKELRAYRKISKDAEEIDLLERYYTADIPEKDSIRRKSVQTLLHNWNGEIDRARQYVDPKKSSRPLKF